jgi:hypothetical protein
MHKAPTVFVVCDHLTSSFNMHQAGLCGISDVNFLIKSCLSDGSSLIGSCAHYGIGGGGGGALPVVLSDVDCLDGSIGGGVCSAACG